MHKLQKRKQNFLHKHTAKTYNKTTRSVPSLLVVFVSRDFPMIPLHLCAVPENNFAKDAKILTLSWMYSKTNSAKIFRVWLCVLGFVEATKFRESGEYSVQFETYLSLIFGSFVLNDEEK